MKKPLLKCICLPVIFLFACLAGPAGATQMWPIFPQAPAKKDAYSLSGSRHFPRTLNYVDKNFVEPERIDPKEMFKGSLSELQKSIPEILVRFDSPTSFTITIDQATKKFSSPLRDLDQFWDLMRDVLTFLELNYRGDVELKDIEAIAINGALSQLDPHSGFLTPEIFKEFKIDTGGEFGGLGIVITSKDGHLTVITPIEDTPAWKAGIRSGDIITQIGDESTINMSLMKAVEALRGKIGTKIAIMVKRKGRSAPFRLILTRDKIQIDSVKSALIKDSGGSVVYIKLKRFQKKTYKDFMGDFKRLGAEAGPAFKGLVIDLRNNPGGLLDEAVELADAFLSEGIIVSTVGANKRFIDEDEAKLNGTEPSDFPIIVLINEGSASASEIVAGALQSHHRALIIGKRTFGKGSVQSVYELGGDFALKLTIAQYLTAGKHSIQTVGVEPDITIEPVIVDKKYIDVAPNKPPSEMELKKHLEQIKPVASHDKKTISYFMPYTEEDDLEERRRTEYSDNIEFKDDFAVKLATRIILAAKSPDPRAMLKEATAVIKNLQHQEEEKISARLGELGTIWGADEGPGPVKLSTASTIKQKGAVVERAMAGEDVNLVLTVNNQGKRPASRLIGVIESENPILDEKEFVFGRLKNGETASREVTIELPHGLNDIDIPFQVGFIEGDEKIAYKYDSTLKISGMKRPRFAINYQLEAPLTVGAPHPLPRGKSVPLLLKIKNIGGGPTKEASAYISNRKDEKGLFIENGRADLGVIRPGEEKKATFTFKVLPAAANSSFLLELTVSDREFMEFMATDLEITLESGAISPPAGIWYEGPEIKLAEKSFPIRSDTAGYRLQGEITDKTAVKDYYIFVNEEKVAYFSNPHESPSMAIDTTLKLKDGNNDITIVARDINKLASYKTFVIDAKER